MPAGRYLFIPFLRTKSQKRQSKNRSSEKSDKKIAGRLPENSRNRFVDRPSKKNSKDRPKKFVFSLKAALLYFD